MSTKPNYSVSIVFTYSRDNLRNIVAISDVTNTNCLCQSVHDLDARFQLSDLFGRTSELLLDLVKVAQQRRYAFQYETEAEVDPGWESYNLRAHRLKWQKVIARFF